MNTNRIDSTSFQLQTIAIARTPYAEKFAVPRQPGLAPSVFSTLELIGDYNHPDCVRGLQDFSHLWLSFIFHQTRQEGWKPLVRPPRLGGNKKVGVFASRSPYRPNHLGLSVVKLEAVEIEKHRVQLIVSGADLVDGTPIVDIKPYVPYADSITDAQGGFAPQAPPRCDVAFDSHCEAFLQSLPDGEQLKQAICEILAQKPQPAYTDSAKDFGMTIYHLNIRWHWSGNCANVFEITLP